MRDILGDRDASVPDVPTKVAEKSRQEQLPKRFYKAVRVEKQHEDYVVLLDGKPVKTPGRSTLAVRFQKIAELMAQEWEAQSERIDPMKMPLTRIVNTAIDGVATDTQAVKEDIIRYAGTDLLCYRVTSPQELVEQQIEHWDPIIDWAHSALAARFDLAEGIMHINQPVEAISAFSVHVGLIDDPLLLAAAHVATSLTGSAIMAMALVKGELDIEKAWQIAHLDEEWNAKQWGRDEDADRLREGRLEEMRAACLIIAEIG